jgi:hypothetical protein
MVNAWAALSCRQKACKSKAQLGCLESGNIDCAFRFSGGVIVIFANMRVDATEVGLRTSAVDVLQVEEEKQTEAPGLELGCHGHQGAQTGRWCKRGN